MKVLLDTNAYSAMKRGHASLTELIRDSEHIFFSPVVVGELLFGFRKGSRYKSNWNDLKNFLESSFVTLLPLGLTTADRFSMIFLSLKNKGKPIPTNDVWVAAQSMELGADLLSFDQHFKHVDGLAWIDPTS